MTQETPQPTPADLSQKEKDLAALAGDRLPEEAVLRRVEQKPPLYRFFRGGMYVLYMAVAVWFCLSITVAAWRSVWGETGEALRQRQGSVQPVTAVPTDR